MKIKVLAPLFCAAFIVCCLTFETLNVAFWISLGVIAAVSAYIERHKNELNAELDEMFGRDDKMI